MLCTQTLLVIARPVLGGGPSCRDCRSLRARRGLGGVVYRGLVKAGSLGGAIAVLGGAIVGHRAGRCERAAQPVVVVHRVAAPARGTADALRPYAARVEASVPWIWSGGVRGRRCCGRW